MWIDNLGTAGFSNYNTPQMACVCFPLSTIHCCLVNLWNMPWSASPLPYFSPGRFGMLFLPSIDLACHNVPHLNSFTVEFIFFSGGISMYFPCLSNFPLIYQTHLFIHIGQPLSFEDLSSRTTLPGLTGREGGVTFNMQAIWMENTW